MKQTMNTTRILWTAALAALVCLGACKKKYTDAEDTRILYFYFAYTDAAPGISDAEFAIDSDNGLIVNSDSLPYACNLKRLYPVITFYEQPYSISIDGEVWNETDSLDFSYPRTLTIVSGDGQNRRDYTVKVLKHQVDPDLFVWKSHAGLPIDFRPKSFQALADETTLTVLVEGPDYTAVLQSTDGDNWDKVKEITESIDVRSAVFSGDSLYAVLKDHSGLYYLLKDMSAEGTLSAGTMQLHDIYGTVGGRLAILAYNGDEAQICHVAGGAIVPTALTDVLPGGLPCEGASKVQIDDRLLVIGGVPRGSEEHSGQVFSTMGDGSYWASIGSNTGRNFGVRAWAAAVYYYKTVYLLGGTRLPTASPANTLNCSHDQGFSWDTADKLNLPADYLSRRLHGGAVWKNSIWLVGGLDKNLQWHTDVHEGRVNRADFIIQ